MEQLNLLEIKAIGTNFPRKLNLHYEGLYSHNFWFEVQTNIYNKTMRSIRNETFYPIHELIADQAWQNLMRR